MIPPVKQTQLDRMVENIKALGLDKTPVYFYSTDFTKGHILTVYDDKRGEDVEIGTIKDFWHPELFSSAPELALEVKRLRGLLMKGSEDYTTSYMDLRRIIEDVHWELTGDEHESNEARIKHALIALREVIG